MEGKKQMTEAIANEALPPTVDALIQNVEPSIARDRCAVIALQMALKAINPERNPPVPGSDEDYIREVLAAYKTTDLDDEAGSPWWDNQP